MSADKLRSAAAAALDCLGVDERDIVLIVCNPPKREIAEALAEVGQVRAVRADVLEYPSPGR